MLIRLVQEQAGGVKHYDYLISLNKIQRYLVFTNHHSTLVCSQCTVKYAFLLCVLLGYHSTLVFSHCTVSCASLLCIPLNDQRSD
jgi:uncharacterized membrane protein